MKIIIVGFGRMGVSHAFQILGSIDSEPELTIVDPSILSRIVSKFLLPSRKYYKTLDEVNDSNFEFGILCTPPYNRHYEVAQISKISKFCLIEKPVLCMLPKNSMSGYVMQYCPTVNFVREIIDKDDLEVSHIEISVQSNVNFSQGQSGWRSEEKAGGILYEFFGHALTFGLCPLSSSNKFIFSDIQVNISERNHFNMNFKVGETKIHCHLYGGLNVRKTRYQCNYKIFGDRNIKFDPYSVEVDKKQVNIPQIAPEIGFFLRAYEFSIQCDRLISGSRDQIDAIGINSIENLLEELV